MNHRHLTCLIASSIVFSSLIAAAQAVAPNGKGPHVESPAPAVEPKKEPPVTSRWQTSIYGFLEFDGMYDTTQSFSDSPGNTPILRSDGSRPAYLPVGTDELKGPMYGATHGRAQATARNTRIGFKMSPPDIAGARVTGVLELDLFGNQPSAPPLTTEGSFFTSATVRLRHAYGKVETDVVDVLFGQYYNIFGWQPNFFPATLSFLGTPNMIFGRTPQLRVSKTIKTDPINVELAGALTRPPQRDSGFPGLEGGLRFEVNGWRGLHGRGSGQPTLDGASIGVSTVYRKFRVIGFANNDPQRRNDITQATAAAEANGLGYSIDALIPVIPVHDLENRTFGLTVSGSFVTGQGIGDLYTGGLTGGAVFPLAAAPGGPFTGYYSGNIDPGLVQYRLTSPTGMDAELRVIKWQSEMAGFQLYLPPAGKLVLAGNFTRSESTNLAQTIAEGGDPARTFRIAHYYDINVFADFTAAIRGALSFQRTTQTYGTNDGSEGAGPNEKNDRFEIGGLFFF